jgi:hypothetical protein
MSSTLDVNGLESWLWDAAIFMEGLLATCPGDNSFLKGGIDNGR